MVETVEGVNCMKAYRKAVAAIVAGVATDIALFADDGKISGDEWYAVVFGLVGAVGVWWFPNAPRRERV